MLHIKFGFDWPGGFTCILPLGGGICAPGDLFSESCVMPSFVEIGQPVPEKKIFEGFLPYMGMAAILVM